MINDTQEMKDKLKADQEKLKNKKHLTKYEYERIMDNKEED